jgi:hypothetical protein
VSVAQYVREAALARLVYTAARRGDDEFELALDLVTGAEGRPAPSEAGDSASEIEELLGPPARARSAIERSVVEAEDTAALWSQGRQARMRAQELRRHIKARQSERR